MRQTNSWYFCKPKRDSRCVCLTSLYKSCFSNLINLNTTTAKTTPKETLRAMIVKFCVCYLYSNVPYLILSTFCALQFWKPIKNSAWIFMKLDCAPYKCLLLIKGNNLRKNSQRYILHNTTLFCWENMFAVYLVFTIVVNVTNICGFLNKSFVHSFLVLTM